MRDRVLRLLTISLNGILLAALLVKANRLREMQLDTLTDFGFMVVLLGGPFVALWLAMRPPTRAAA
jgi:hypothetical protein